MILPFIVGLAPLPAQAAICRASVVAIEAGGAIDANNTAPVACEEAPTPAKLWFDRKVGVARARVALSPGEPLGRVHVARRPAILPGDPVVLTARVGVVTISRQASALQGARTGERFFARGSDGAIFVAPPVSAEAGR